MKAEAAQSQRGFTLLELSIVLLIIAVVTGMAVTSGISVIATSRQVGTQNRLDTLEQALLQFRTANNRLPCPGDLTLAPGSANYGIEAATPGTCTGGSPAANFSALGATNTFATGAEGALPAVTLGLPIDFMVDGWGNKFRYVVDTSMTANGAFVTTPAGCIDGAITVKDNNGSARSANAIYALISSGANGHGAYTKKGVITNAASNNANEQINCHCDINASPTAYAHTYVQQPIPTNTFDDIVTFKERWQMQIAWDTMGKCLSIYVSDINNNNVQKFTVSGAYVSQFGSHGTGSGQFNADPAGGNGNDSGEVAFDTSGNIFVADPYNNRVQKFNSSGSFLAGIGAGYNGVTGSVGTAGTGNGQLNYPTGVAIDSSGNIWVVEQSNHRVQKFSSSLAYLLGVGAGYQGVGGSVGSTGGSNGQFSYPSIIASDASGNVWVTDLHNNRAQKFNSSGTYVTSIGAGYNGVAGAIGSSGSLNGQFNWPFGIAIDTGGNIWVVDNNNNRAQKFNSSGTYLMSLGASYNGVAGALGTAGSINGQFNYPLGITTDSSNNVWVVDSVNHRVEKFNSSGTYLTQLGCATGACAHGAGNGQFYYPDGIGFGNR